MSKAAKLSVWVRVDNIGAIFMTDNFTSIQRTKHVGIHHCYVPEFAMGKLIRIVIAETEASIENIFTKKTMSGVYDKRKQMLASRVKNRKQKEL